MLLANSNVENNQRISVLAASSPKESDFEATATTDEFLDSISYSSIASIIRQCDTTSSAPSTIRPLPVANVTVPRSYQRKRLSPQQLADLKSRSECHVCHKFGHWSTGHKQDGSLKPGVRSTEQPAPPKNNGSSFNNNSTISRKPVSFKWN